MTMLWVLCMASLAAIMVLKFVFRERTGWKTQPSRDVVPAPSVPIAPSRPSSLGVDLGLTEEDMGCITPDLLASVRERWLAMRDGLVAEYPEAVHDLFLFPRQPILMEAMLLRFLRAESNMKSPNVAKTALERIYKTALFRRDYRVLDFHRRGMAEALLLHSTNSDAALYFGDCGVTSKLGEPVIIGRLGLIKGVDVHSANHLRAGLFVIERVVAKLILPLRKASYILDLSNLDGLPPLRFWNDTAQIAPLTSDVRPASVGPHLPGHLEIAPGLPVLKEAVAMVTANYPELLRKVYFYNPPAWFYVMFKVFSLWFDKVTRAKFVMVQQGSERVFLEAIAENQLPVELGGKGIRLDRDGFMRTCLNIYDDRATLPYAHDLSKSRLSGTPFELKPGRNYFPAIVSSSTSSSSTSSSSTSSSSTSSSTSSTSSSSTPSSKPSKPSSAKPSSTTSSSSIATSLTHTSPLKRPKKSIWQRVKGMI